MQPNLALKVISTKLLSSFGHRDFKKFIILTRSRTGSNMLMTYLNDHPHIASDGEVLGTLAGQDYKKILAKVFGKQPFFIKAKGFKIFYYHPLDEKPDDLWTTLADMNDLHVIHLKRKNILRTLISREIAGIQNVWYTSSSQQQKTDQSISVSFTAEDLADKFEQTRNWEQGGDELFKHHPLLTVYYEDLANDRDAAFKKVTDFLGFEYIHPETPLTKQNNKSLKETVSNYDELKMAFSGTEWESFFEE